MFLKRLAIILIIMILYCLVKNSKLYENLDDGAEPEPEPEPEPDPTLEKSVAKKSKPYEPLEYDNDEDQNQQIGENSANISALQNKFDRLQKQVKANQTAIKTNGTAMHKVAGALKKKGKAIAGVA